MDQSSKVLHICQLCKQLYSQLQAGKTEHDLHSAVGHDPQEITALFSPNYFTLFY